MKIFPYFSWCSDVQGVPAATKKEVKNKLNQQQEKQLRSQEVKTTVDNEKLRCSACNSRCAYSINYNPGCALVGGQYNPFINMMTKNQKFGQI
jgi:hypothetical protein